MAAIIATKRPVAVAISASPMPALIAKGFPAAILMTLKDWIIPVTVPNKPNKGAKVIINSKISRFFCKN